MTYECEKCNSQLEFVTKIITDYDYNGDNELVFKDKELWQCSKCKSIEAI